MSERPVSMFADSCARCGGGIDADHPTTCSACRYEIATGRSYERDVDTFGTLPRVIAPEAP